ncbi:MAG: serpin family protein [Roseiflexus sp.]|jgi:serpin B|uniref:serpin family protein n=1 Tax=Roseiflexus sp. TaxID=2562120 RepID=UPI0025CD4E6F|nr:serpin family protein [Roseiflexus sp.]MCL6542253.1 serpin family protein [Roseiflexus sp.]
MKFLIRHLLIDLLALSPVTGGARSGGDMASVQLVRSSAARVTAPEVPLADLQELRRGIGAFAFDLYRTLQEDQERVNFFYSPFSISITLAMTWAGAREETEREMADVLHFTLPQDRLHPAFNALDLELTRRGQGARGKDGKGFRLNIVNALWGQTDFRFLPEFLDGLARNYSAGLRLLDFVNDAEAARKVINRWISDQTEGRIQELIRLNMLNEMTRLVLTDAIYFNAAWAQPFEKQLTADEPFYLLDGSQVMTPMMQHDADWNYLEGEGFQAVSVPYDGGELSMVILLPREGRFKEFERSLDFERADQILEGMTPHRVLFKMPRFRMESSLDLKDILSRMGMSSPFKPDLADFSGMNGERNLFIHSIAHQAFILVDEAGTEAAAATALFARVLSAPLNSVEMTVNRPFFFFIRDHQTGAILFVGRVLNPTR